MKAKVFLIATLFVVSFSMMSFANAEPVHEQETITLESDTPCTDQWLLEVNFLMDYFGASFEEADNMANGNWERCMEETYG